MTKYFVLDTNILLLDGHAIFGHVTLATPERRQLSSLAAEYL